MKNVLFLAILIALTASTCQDPLMEKILRVHTQTVSLEKETSPIMDELIQVRNRINIQGRALTEEELSLTEEINSMETRWEEWKQAFHATDPATVAKTERDSFLKTQQEFQQTLLNLKTSAESILANPL